MIVVDSNVVYEEVQSTLRSGFEPVPGAVEIGLTAGGVPTGGECTLGFNARTLSGVNLAITADHCTTSNAYATGNAMFQPSTTPTRQIATEDAVVAQHFPPGASTNDPCFVEFFCRFADAAAFVYVNSPFVTASPLFGALARPFFQSVSVDPAIPTFTVSGTVGVNEWVSQVDRIGRTTGWSTGSIFRRCTSWQNNNGVLNLCQNEANITVQGGDSGGPVFINNGNGTGRLEGVTVGRYRAGIWGSGGWKMVYSRYHHIESGLPYGPLIVTP